MELEDEFLRDGLLMMVLIYNEIKSKKKCKRRWAVRPANRDRVTGGYYAKVFKRIKDIDHQLFFSNTRVKPEIYNLLYGLIKNSLEVKRSRVSADERLPVTISYLAHGVTIPYLALSFKLGRSTLRKIILDVCELLWQTLSPIYVAEPTQSQYQDIANDFSKLWNAPNCCGAIDGKHFPIKCPDNSGSQFFNYKQFFSIVLMSACDAKCTFTNVSIGSYGSECDAGIFRTSDFGKKVYQDGLPLPPCKPLSNTTRSEEPFPHYFVADAAFPLLNNLMRPYPGKHLSTEKQIFNYRLSRARRMIENSFGVLTTRWRVLLNTLEWSPKNAERVILACIALHNFVILNDHSRWYCNESYVDWETADYVVHDGEWRAEARSVGGDLRSIRGASHRPTTTAYDLRNQLSAYFMHEGSVPFQYKIIN